jgi:hypothetical protein
MGKPACQWCQEKPARSLNLPWDGGDRIAYCTLKCAAMMGLMAAQGIDWCATHDEWYHDSACPDCEKES